MMHGRFDTWRRLAAAVLLALSAALPAVVSAHEIPNDALIQAFVRPAGTQLQLLVRVPLIAMRDMTWRYKAQDTLDLERSAQALRDAATLWVGDDVSVFENGVRLQPQTVAHVIATPLDDRSFENVDSALSLLSAPQRDIDVAVPTGYLDVLFTYPIQSASSRFSVEPRWGRLGQRSVTTIRLMLADGSTRAFEFAGNPGYVDLDPLWSQAGWRFLKVGFRHVLNGTDYLLFLLCLVLPFRTVRSLVTIVAAFTVAHSLTLVASAFNFGPDSLWFPPFIELLVAASIVCLAADTVIGPRLHRRWLSAAGFGLAFGFAFSFGVKPELQFAGSHALASVLAFNVGVELAQLAVLLPLVVLLRLLFSQVVQERLGTIVLSVLAAHTGWHWMTSRYETLLQYDLSLPEFTPAVIAEWLRYAMVLVALGGILWMLSSLTKTRDDAEATS